MKVVWNSFSGRCSDSPRALHRALLARGGDDEHVWLVDPRHAAGFPDDVQTVPYGGAACIEALESADVVVSNNHLDLDWTKAPGARYLQTWHGTPLKHIHRDVLWAPPGRLDRLDEDIARWDVLVSPSPTATTFLRQAFRWDGPVLETGYPRNDALLAPGAGDVRARVRRDLGVPDGVPAVLYTPTWREDLLAADGGFDFALHLDLEAVTARLGDAVLLLRLHYELSHRLGGVQHPQVVDVSAHPEVSDLYLAADAMVTDYSSTMFDFAVTGKPMAFFTYDLADYRDRLRGFYFDVSELPGPLLQTSAEVAEVLADLDGLARERADDLAAFRQRFCSLEDGSATERVLDQFFGGSAPDPRSPHSQEVSA